MMRLGHFLLLKMVCVFVGCSLYHNEVCCCKPRVLSDIYTIASENCAVEFIRGESCRCFELLPLRVARISQSVTHSHHVSC
jgi:hypothetical protein